MDCGVVVWYSDRDANQREVIGCTSGTYNPSLRELSLRQSWAGLNLTVSTLRNYGSHPKGQSWMRGSGMVVARDPTDPVVTK